MGKTDMRREAWGTAVREWGALACCIFLAAAALFTAFRLGVKTFLLFYDGAWALLLSSFRWRGNRRFFARALAAATGCAAAFWAVKRIGGAPARPPADMVEWVLLALGAAGTLAALACCRGEEGKTGAPPPLYPERVHDLSRVRGCIRQFEVLGIDAGWGAGKSFLLDALKRDPEIGREFEVVQVDLLACDLDAVERTLVEELEKLLLRERIYPENPHRLKRLLGKNEWAGLLGGLVAGDGGGLAASYEGLCRELGKLRKKVCVVFEDVDRVLGPDTIQKIFAISQKISGSRLHTIFQFDAEELEKKGFGRGYMEKYVPYTVGLTPIPLEKLVGYLWEELGMEEVPLKRETVCRVGEHLPGLFGVNQLLGTKLELQPRFRRSVTPRRARIFLLETKEALRMNEKLREKGGAEIVLHTMVAKHFFNPQYRLFEIGESPLQTLKLEREGHEYTVAEAFVELRRPETPETPEQESARLKKLHEMLDAPGNAEVLYLLLLLGYEIGDGPSPKAREAAVAEPLESLLKREKNGKIDRVVWNVLANGTSELTDMEHAVDKLCGEVLPKSGKAREQAWLRYDEEMYHQRLWKDNRTVFRIGMGPFLPLFQAMRVTGASETQWQDFLGFYFSQYQKGKAHRSVSIQLVRNCNYCSCDSKKTFFQVIRFFSRLEVVGNMNSQKAYHTFWRQYLGMIPMLGYCGCMAYWNFEVPGELMEDGSFPVGVMQELKRDLAEQKQEEPSAYIRTEYDDLLAFVEKNLELVRHPAVLPEPGMHVEITDHKTLWRHQEEVDRLRKLGEELTPEAFEAELENSYKDGRIDYSELKDARRGSPGKTG